MTRKRAWRWRTGQAATTTSARTAWAHSTSSRSYAARSVGVRPPRRMRRARISALTTAAGRGAVSVRVFMEPTVLGGYDNGPRSLRGGLAGLLAQFLLHGVAVESGGGG